MSISVNNYPFKNHFWNMVKHQTHTQIQTCKITRIEKVKNKRELFEENKKVLDDRFSFVKDIGKGSFGRVIRALDLDEMRTVAIKIQKKSHDLESIRRESLFCKYYANHPNIIKIYGTYETVSELHIVMEEGEWNLQKFVQERGNMFTSNETIRSIAIQIAKGLQWMHTHHFVHTDLKPENIIIQPSVQGGFSAKLIDFGQTRNVRDLTDLSRYSWQSLENIPYITTRWYRAPEMILGIRSFISEKIDMWSLACVLCFIRLGTDIFRGVCELDMLCWFDAILGDIPQSLVDLTLDELRRIYFRLPRSSLPCNVGPYEPSTSTNIIIDALVDYSPESIIISEYEMNPNERVIFPKLYRKMFFESLEKRGRRDLRVNFSSFFNDPLLAECVQNLFVYDSNTRFSADDFLAKLI